VRRVGHALLCPTTANSNLTALGAHTTAPRLALNLPQKCVGGGRISPWASKLWLISSAQTASSVLKNVHGGRRPLRACSIVNARRPAPLGRDGSVQPAPLEVAPLSDPAPVKTPPRLARAAQRRRTLETWVVGHGLRMPLVCSRTWVLSVNRRVGGRPAMVIIIALHFLPLFDVARGCLTWASVLSCACGLLVTGNRPWACRPLQIGIRVARRGRGDGGITSGEVLAHGDVPRISRLRHASGYP
jgi:hypothetical protein